MTGARAPALVAQLREAVAGPVREGELLARYSTFRIGGPATVAHPVSAADVSAALRVAAQAGVGVFVLGLGSNVLLPDEGLDALVLRLGKGLDQASSDGARWRLGAGLPAPLIARRTASAGWAGLHIMVGVPGTVGGGVYMNAGCHGGDWATVVRSVTVVDRRGEVTTRPREEIPFGYRRSGLKDCVVVEAEIELTPRDPPELEAEVQRLFAWRQEGTPFNQPCCGSVFKNPAWPAGPPGPGLRTAGQIIEACGLKGLVVGRIEVSPLHANYFVNRGQGRADEVRRLMETVRARVQERFGVLLEPEVKVIRPSGETG